MQTIVGLGVSKQTKSHLSHRDQYTLTLSCVYSCMSVHIKRARDQTQSKSHLSHRDPYTSVDSCGCDELCNHIRQSHVHVCDHTDVLVNERRSHKPTFIYSGIQPCESTFTRANFQNKAYISP